MSTNLQKCYKNPLILTFTKLDQYRYYFYIEDVYLIFIFKVILMKKKLIKGLVICGMIGIGFTALRTKCRSCHVLRKWCVL